MKEGQKKGNTVLHTFPKSGKKRTGEGEAGVEPMEEKELPDTIISRSFLSPLYISLQIYDEN
jgi:hypothetical protein